MKIQDLQNGDQLFQRNKFNICDLNTWMSPIIYFGLNLWNWILKRPVCPVNHCGTMYKVVGRWYVYEAKMTFRSTLLSKKLANKDITELYIKRYDLTELQQDKMFEKAVCLLGMKYDFWSILKQVARQLFNMHVDLETNPRKFKNKSLNCSEANAEQLQTTSHQFNNTKNVSPADLWFDTRSKLIGRLK